MKGLARFDRLNVIAGEETAALALTEGAEAAAEKYRELTHEAYEASVEEAAASLRAELEADEDEYEELYLLEFDGKTGEEKLVEYAKSDDPAAITRLVESELHRIFNGGLFASAVRSGRDFTKTWVTRDDDRVRETHEYLHGVSVRANEPFATFDGDTAMYPGGFSKAENNVNCRCVISISPA